LIRLSGFGCLVAFPPLEGAKSLIWKRRRCWSSSEMATILCWKSSSQWAIALKRIVFTELLSNMSS
jgi:hypothetical protein